MPSGQFKHLRDSFLPEFRDRGFFPQAISSLARQNVAFEQERGVPDLESGGEFGNRLLQQWLTGLGRQSSLSRERTSQSFARQGLTGTPQEAAAQQRVDLGLLQGVGEAYGQSTMLNLQRRMQELLARQQQRSGTIDLLRNITTFPQPGFYNPYNPGGAGIPAQTSSLGSALGKFGGSILGGISGGIGDSLGGGIGGFLGGLLK